MFPVSAYGIDEFHKKLEEHLLDEYKGRPHWGKNLFLNLDKAYQLYPDLDKWKRVYLLFNSDGTFDNEFTRKVGFDIFRGGEGGRASIHLFHSLKSEQAIHVATISGQQVSTVSAQAENEVTATTHVQQTTTVTAEPQLADQAHVKFASSSNIVYAKVDHSKAKVVTSQPRRSIHMPQSRQDDSRNHAHHFVPVPLHHNRRYTVNADKY